MPPRQASANNAPHSDGRSVQAPETIASSSTVTTVRCQSQARAESRQIQHPPTPVSNDSKHHCPQPTQHSKALCQASQAVGARCGFPRLNVPRCMRLRADARRPALRGMRRLRGAWSSLGSTGSGHTHRSSTGGASASWLLTPCCSGVQLVASGLPEPAWCCMLLGAAWSRMRLGPARPCVSSAGGGVGDRLRGAPLNARLCTASSQLRTLRARPLLCGRKGSSQHTAASVIPLHIAHRQLVSSSEAVGPMPAQQCQHTCNMAPPAGCDPHPSPKPCCCPLWRSLWRSHRGCDLTTKLYADVKTHSAASTHSPWVPAAQAPAWRVPHPPLPTARPAGA